MLSVPDTDTITGTEGNRATSSVQTILSAASCVQTIPCACALTTPSAASCVLTLPSATACVQTILSAASRGYYTLRHRCTPPLHLLGAATPTYYMTQKAKVTGCLARPPT